jgi:arabinan endo-1,5-alpha-L-arabinosidase
LPQVTYANDAFAAQITLREDAPFTFAFLFGFGGSMKSRFFAAILVTVLAAPAFALDGQVGIHDPSTVVQCDGKYYTFGTGSGGLISDDGWTWRGGAVRPGGGVAPDVIKIGDRYLVTYSGSGVHTMWTKSLDPNSPDCRFTDDTVIAAGDIDCDAIDSCLLMAPDGKLWMTYGSYRGYIREIELDPKTGKRINNDKPLDIAINCEATELIYRDGWYYLFANHGSCCIGAASTYSIRVGRAKKPTGPFLDNVGVDMLKGGGRLFAAAQGRVFGPGHFGLLDSGDGVQKWSCHYEADLDRGGASVLDIRPLLWKDGWPVAGDNFKEGTYQIESVRAGMALELAVEGVNIGGGRGGGMRGGAGGARGAMPGAGGPRGGPATAPAATAPGVLGPTLPDGLVPVAAGAAAGGGAMGGAGRGRGGGMGGGGMGGGGMGGGGMFGGAGAGVVIPSQDVAQVAPNWPKGNIELRTGFYMCQAQQKWTISPVANSGGYPGSPFFKITIAGTNRALAATEDAELVTVPEFTGSSEQLWRFDQLADGTYRIMPKAVPNSKEALALSAVGNAFATLSKFDPASEKHRWNLKAP